MKLHRGLKGKQTETEAVHVIWDNSRDISTTPPRREKEQRKEKDHEELKKKKRREKDEKNRPN